MPLAHAAVARNINIVVVVKNFSDGTVIEIDRGRFDDWCIYITGTCNRHAPKDVAYFTVVRGFGKRYGVDKVYADFISIYDKTSKSLDRSVLDHIETLSKDYGEYSNKFAIVFTIIYLGIHQVLYDRYSPAAAASFSRGLPWTRIDNKCKLRGF